MSEEIKTSPDIVPDSNKLDVEPVEEKETPESDAQTAVATARKGDPWKTAFIVLAGITIISGTIYFTTYGRKSDLPTVPTADPNAMPVQMANPPTGASEQSALRQPLPTVVGNAADMLQAVPGDGYDPWANPGRYQSNSSSNPYPVTPVGPPGQQVYMESNPNSPFMSDGNTYIMVPANSNPGVNANRGGANTNRPPKPVTSPSPGTAPAANTASPTMQPKPNVKPDAQPANKPPAKPKKPSTGKPNGTE
ncbi:MAG TPA: hypothetical protein VGO50_03975 [Pyrinomonadaceae bacterium]|jgi:hypothetical protein|nr:hypothetical protein [Pyrinomonadaceae bacterium]